MARNVKKLTISKDNNMWKTKPRGQFIVNELINSEKLYLRIISEMKT